MWHGEDFQQRADAMDLESHQRPFSLAANGRTTLRVERRSRRPAIRAPVSFNASLGGTGTCGRR
jgi:hypothetical protein